MIEDIGRDERLPLPQGAPLLGPGLLVPLSAGDRVVGTLVVARTRAAASVHRPRRAAGVGFCRACGARARAGAGPGRSHAACPSMTIATASLGICTTSSCNGCTPLDYASRACARICRRKPRRRARRCSPTLTRRSATSVLPSSACTNLVATPVSARAYCRSPRPPRHRLASTRRSGSTDRWTRSSPIRWARICWPSSGSAVQHGAAREGDLGLGGRVNASRHRPAGGRR